MYGFEPKLCKPPMGTIFLKSKSRRSLILILVDILFSIQYLSFCSIGHAKLKNLSFWPFHDVIKSHVTFGKHGTKQAQNWNQGPSKFQKKW